MSRRVLAGWIAVVVAGFALYPAAAHDGATGSPPERIDLTVTQPARSANEAECERRRESAILSGEIVVCGGREREGPQPYSSREDARNRYAERTRNAGTLPTPDVAGAGIFCGPATPGRPCATGVFHLPQPPPALLVEFASLPKGAPGSAADRIARGLDPLGEDNRAILDRQMAARQRQEMGLPAPVGEPEVSEGEAPVSSAGSAAPVAPQ